MRLVTIGLCVKNCEKTIKDTLNSILNQDFPHSDIEIIVVDGGSRDNTLEIIKNIPSMRNVPSIRILYQKDGLGASRQAVVDEAVGQFIAWVDGDVILSRSFLKEQVEFLNKNADVGFVGGKNEYIISHKTLVSEIQHLLFSEVKTVHLCASLCRVKALKDCGGFDARIIGANEDVDIKMRLIMAGWKLAINPKAVFYHNDPRRNLKELYIKYRWYGYGTHFLGHKYENLIKFPFDLIAYIGWGIKIAFRAYKRTQKKISFLIPVLCVFHSIFSFIGFLEGHLSGYGHLIGKPEFSKDLVLRAKRQFHNGYRLSSITSAKK